MKFFIFVFSILVCLNVNAAFWIPDGSVTASKLSPKVFSRGANTGFYSSNATSYGDVTNASVTIATVGTPVIMVGLNPIVGSAFNSYIGVAAGAGRSMGTCYLRLLRGVTQLTELVLSGSGSSGSAGYKIPPGALQVMDAPTAGTLTYKVQAKCESGDTIEVRESQIYAVQL